MIEVSLEIRTRVHALAENFNLSLSTDLLEQLAWDAARVKGWLSVEEARPKRKEQAAALKMISTTYDRLSRTLLDLNAADTERLNKVIDQFEATTSLGPTDYVFNIPILLNRLGGQVSRHKSDPDAIKLAQSFVDAAALATQLDDFSQSALFDELAQTKLPSTIDATVVLAEALKVITSAANTAASELSKAGRTRPVELHASVGYLLERYESITEKNASYYLNDDDEIASDSGRFVFAMLNIAGSTAQPTTVNNAIEQYCNVRNKKQ